VKYPNVQRWLNERMALDSSLMDGAGFNGVVAERLAALGCANEHEYVGVLERSRDESEWLAGSVAVPETWLFRYPQSFAVLVEHLSRRRMQGASHVRMISVGCASGEEPYGMAMAALHAGWPAEMVEIDAIDRNAVVLARADTGVYGAFSIRHEVPAWAVTHLQHERDRIVVDPKVRAMVRFRRADALEPGALGGAGFGGGCDAVFCRNVLIYLKPEARTALIASIAEKLDEGGLLFVGHAEQMLAVGPSMRRMDAAHSFALEKVKTPLQVPVREPIREDAPWVRPIPVIPRVTPAVRVSPAPAEPPVARERDIDDARDLADAGMASESETLIRSIMARKGPSADGLELLGTLRQSSGDARGAKQLFEQALYLEPNRPTALLQLALIHEKLGDGAQAELLWDRVRRASAAPSKGGRR